MGAPVPVALVALKITMAGSIRIHDFISFLKFLAPMGMDEQPVLEQLIYYRTYL
jgi:hypothetical protein